MKYAFILARTVAFPIAVMCRVLGVSTSGFYAWRAKPESERDRRRRALTPEILRIFEASRRTYGSPRVHRELRAEGVFVNRKTVAAIMRSEGLVARPKRRFQAATDSQHDDPIAPNLVARNFTANERDETWVGDVTAIWTAQGWLFLAVLLDLFSRRVVGWATSASNDRFLALAALRDGLAKRQPEPGLVHHTDRGTPYASGDYRDELDRFGIVPRMSRKGDCWDNAVAESFFSTTKTEAIGDRIPADHNEATRLLAEYIDGFYNTVRRHSFLDYRSPIEFELHSASVLAAA